MTKASNILEPLKGLCNANFCYDVFLWHSFNVDTSQMNTHWNSGEENRHHACALKRKLRIFILPNNTIWLACYNWNFLLMKFSFAQKEVVFQNLNILSGSDASGVPTTMITFNGTVKININNRSPYLKVNVKPFQIEIYLSLLSIATSQVLQLFSLF